MRLRRFKVIDSHGEVHSWHFTRRGAEKWAAQLREEAIEHVRTLVYDVQFHRPPDSPELYRLIDCYAENYAAVPA